MDGILATTNKDHNRSYSYMMQRQPPSSDYRIDHLTSCIPTNKHSRLVTKQSQKIRIIHIIPPEIIQIDKANFRNLVQSLTGRSSSSVTKTSIKKQHRPQVSSNDQNMSYLLGFSGSNYCSDHTELSSNKKLLDVPNHHEQLNLNVASDHEVLVGGFQANDWNYETLGLKTAKVEKDEVTVQAPVATEWGMNDKLENGFCIDGFLELDEWLSQDIKLPNLMPLVGSSWPGIDLFGEL